MLARAQIAEREDRLRTFNRALTHELRNRIGAAMGAAQIMEMPEIEAPERQRLNGVVLRNVESMRGVLDNLLVLTGVPVDSRQQRHVHLPEAAQEAARQVRAAARARTVDIRIDPELPPVEVSAAAVELCLTNLLANAIKYSDPGAGPQWVEIRGRLSPIGGSAGGSHRRGRGQRHRRPRRTPERGSFSASSARTSAPCRTSRARVSA